MGLSRIFRIGMTSELDTIPTSEPAETLAAHPTVHSVMIASWNGFIVWVASLDGAFHPRGGGGHREIEPVDLDLQHGSDHDMVAHTENAGLIDVFPAQ